MDFILKGISKGLLMGVGVMAVKENYIAASIMLILEAVIEAFIKSRKKCPMEG